MRIPCSRKQQKELQTHGKVHIAGILGGKGSDRFKQRYRGMVCWMWGEIRDCFKVGSYKEIPAHKYDDAIGWIDQWKPNAPPALAEPEPKKCFLCETAPATTHADGEDVCQACAILLQDGGNRR